jgi:hypothetical protein
VKLRPAGCISCRTTIRLIEDVARPHDDLFPAAEGMQAGGAAARRDAARPKGDRRTFDVHAY